MDVSVRISASHHAPRRGQPVRSLTASSLLESVRRRIGTAPQEFKLPRLNPPGACPYPATPLRLLLPLILALPVAVPLAPWTAQALPPGQPLAGVYKGELGQLALGISEDGWVTAQVMSGFCGTEPGRVALDGALEGNQLVGRLLACLRCGRVTEERVVDFTAAWLPGAAQWVGYVTLESTCTFAETAQAGALERVEFTRDPLGARPLKLGNAAALERRAAQEVEQLAGRTPERVRQGMLRALSYDPSARTYARVATWMLANGEQDGALQLLEHAAAVGGAWEPHVELARHWARRRDGPRAFSALRAALDARLPRAQEILGEPDFLELRGSPEYAELLRAIRAEKERNR